MGMAATRACSEIPDLGKVVGVHETRSWWVVLRTRDNRWKGMVLSGGNEEKRTGCMGSRPSPLEEREGD
jgi:hypothetical protein